MSARVPTVDSNGHIFDKHLPDRLQVAALIESIQDAVAASIVAGTNITTTYDDTAGTLTISSTASGGAGGTTDPEIVRDTVAAALRAGTNITITNNDAGDTITIAVSGLSTIATSGSAADLTAGTIPTARLGSGIASATSILYGDSTFKAAPTADPVASTAGLRTLGTGAQQAASGSDSRITGALPAISGYTVVTTTANAYPASRPSGAGRVWFDDPAVTPPAWAQERDKWAAV